MCNITVANVWVDLQVTDLVTYVGHSYFVVRVYRGRNEVTLSPVV